MRRLAFSLTVLALVATACGGSDDDPVVVPATTTAIFATTTVDVPTGDASAATTTTEAVYEAPTTTTTITAAPATTTEAPPEVAESVTVEAGDSLSKIAKRFGTNVDTLVRINELCDANQIFVGQVILLTDPDADEPAEEGDVLIVTVMAGDSLTKIAKRHDTTVEEIMERNAIDDANLLFVGQELVIDGDVPAPDEPEVNPNC
ncbi:MAG: LysM peptidoglycan-binding domain-containing protein [Acidimicrobiales bacterium]|jgi:lysozyme|nr:LysM peptidoglycan-binding domain-containing protein [Acidimicrobiales bacterium]